MATFFKKYWYYFVILIVGLAISWPLLTKGLFSNHDEMNSIRFLAVRDCIEDVQLPCRWSKDLGWGNGFPIFNYYAPGPYYVGAILSYLVGFINAEKILILFALVAGGFGMFLFIKEMFNEKAGLLSAILYTYAPYKAVDVYVRGALSEAIALSIVPFLFFFVYKIIKQKESKLSYLFIFTLFTFLISHNIMTILFIPLLGIFGLTLLIKYGAQGLKSAIPSGLLGLLLSSFYLIPAFFEKKLVRVDTLTGEYYNFQNHFASIKQIFISNFWGYGSSGVGLSDGMSFQIGYVHWILAVLAIAILLYRLIKKNVNWPIVVVSLAFILSTFMMHNKSAIIWEALPILKYLQFPWRFLSIAIFSTSVLAGYLISETKGKVGTAILIISSIVAIIINWNYFKPEKYYTNLNDENIFKGEVWEQQRSGILLDYLPVGAIEARESASDVPIIREGNGIIYHYETTSNKFSFDYVAISPSVLEIPIYDFPNWTVKVNNQDKEIVKSSVGRIMVNLEKGNTKVTGEFKDTPLRDFANLISLITFIGVLFVMFKDKIGKINFDKKLLLTALVISIPAIWSFASKGLYGFSDDSHIGWMFEMDRAIKAFKFPPRFVPDLSFGFGYPLFNFVYPLPFYLGEIFHLLGLSLVASLKLVFALSIPLSLITMYKLLREYLNKDYSLLGAVIYVYAPYRATELFVRGAIGEIVAFIFIPLVAWSFIKLTKEQNLKWIAVSGISIAALIMSHNILAYMFMPFALLLLVARIIFIYKNKISIYLKSLSAIILGLLISMYFWLPAVVESSLMKYSTVFNYLDHYPTLKQLVTPFFGHGASVPGPYDGISFYVGIIGIFVTLVGIIHFAIKRNDYSLDEKIFMGWAIAIVGISVFMMNHRSAFIWEAVPFIKYFQFPWRFLTPVVFALPIFLLSFEKNNPIKYAPYILITLTVLVNFPYFKPESFLGREDSFYINRFVPYPTASEEYKTTSEEYLRLPKDQTVRPINNYPLVDSQTKGVKSVVNLNAYDSIIFTDYPQSFTLNYNKYMFPGWVAYIDGVKTKIDVGSPLGQLSITVPKGIHKVEIYYRETLFRNILNIISLSAFLAAVYMIVKKKK